jgi:hypothetical protein
MVQTANLPRIMNTIEIPLDLITTHLNDDDDELIRPM